MPEASNENEWNWTENVFRGMQCRICLDTDRPNRMVSPCSCRGSIQYIHRACLYTEQQHRREEWERTGALICTVCREPYNPRYLRVSRCDPTPEIAMSSLIQLCILLMVLTHTSTELVYKLTTALCVAWNIAMVFVWTRVPFRYSVLQHLLIHIVTGILAVKRFVPSDLFELVPCVLTGLLAIYYNVFTFYALVRDDDLSPFPLQCIAAMLTIEYVLINIAFEQSVLNSEVSTIFTMSFTNICIWGHAATRVYQNNP